MVKAKFGDTLRRKSAVDMRSGILCKILCQNICCLISAMIELGIEPSSWAHETHSEFKAV